MDFAPVRGSNTSPVSQEPHVHIRCLTLSLMMMTGGCAEQDASPSRGGFKRAPTLVITTPVQSREIRQEIEAIGTAMANESLTLTAKVTDTVSRVRFEDGALVAKDDVLVELTDTEEAALLRESEANVTDARLQYERLNDLFEQGSVPQSQVDEARARFDAAQARQESLLARLNDRLVRAPFSGLLGFRQISEGTLLTPNTPITTLDDVSVIKLDFAIPAVRLGLIQIGQNLLATSAAYPDDLFAATVRTIGSRVNPVTRAATIRAHIDNTDLRLRPGMLMTVKLTVTSRSALMVPERAILQRASETFVYTVDEQRAVLTKIQPGDYHNGWIEVLSGLTEGEPVVTQGVVKLRDQAPVRLSGQSTPTSANQRPA